jgi:predicted DNA-binding transcriptional regulator
VDPGDPVIVLRGNSLRIYLYLLRMRRPMGVRDIWRELDISSPSLVQYHIDRLGTGLSMMVGSTPWVRH